MSTHHPSESTYVFRLVGLLAVFVGAGAAGRLLALPFPPVLVGLAAVALALRLAVMFEACAVPPSGEPAAAELAARPSLHAAHP